MLSCLVLRSLNDNVSVEDQAALVRGMVAGSRRAWRDFQAQYGKLIVRCIARVLGRFSLCASDEDVREVHATLLVQLCAGDMSRLRGFDAGRGNQLGAWIGTMATNCAIDHLRLARREPNRSTTLDEIADDVLDDEPTPDEALDRKERLAIAAELLRDLPEKDRELFTLYYTEGLEPEQIAARMAISVNTVYSKKHKLQSRFEARFAEPRYSRALAA